MKDVPNKIAGDKYLTSDFNDGVNKPLRRFITDSGQAFNDTDDTQIVKAVVALNASRASYIETAGSTGTSYIIDLADTGKEGLFALKTGTTISVIITNENDTTTPTLSFLNPALGPVNIKRLNGDPLVIGEFEAGFIVDLYYNGTDFLVKNLNDATSLKDIEQEQIYTVDSVVGNQYNLSRSSGLNPTAYYDGMVIKFICTQTNTGAVTLKVDALAPVSLVDSQGRVMQPTDISSSDLIVALYSAAGNNFRVIKKTEQIWLNSDDILETRSSTGDPYALINFNSIKFFSASPVNISSSNDKQFIVLAANLTNYTINLPDVATITKGFSIEIIAVNSFLPTTITFAPFGSNEINVNGQGSIPFIFEATSGSHLSVRYNDDNLFNWMISGIGKASQTQSGVSRFANQTETNAGTRNDLSVSPLTLKDVPFIANLEVVYPVTSKFFSDSPLMVTNPDQIVPGWGTFTWVPVGVAGERFAHTIASPASLQTTGSLGSNDHISGSANGFTLLLAHIPPHAHRQQTIFEASDPDWQADFTDPVVTQRSFGFDKDGGSTFNNTAGRYKPFGSPDIFSEGGGQSHTHGLGIKSYIDYCYRRTA